MPELRGIGLSGYDVLTWRVGGLSEQILSRVISSTLKGILLGVMVLTSP